MTKLIKVITPDIGDFKDVPIIELLIKDGDTVEIDQPLITIESDKATMEIPSTHSGVVKKILIKVGDKISKGTPICDLQTENNELSKSDEKTNPITESQSNMTNNENILNCDTVVIGAGPGGYTAAFRASDLGQDVILIEKYEKIGGVCLNVGCIPSKALLHAAKIIEMSHEMKNNGISFSKPEIDIHKIHTWKNSIINKLTSGLTALSKKRKIKVLQGLAEFNDNSSITVNKDNSNYIINFKNAIIATGSSSIKLGSFPSDKRILNSTSILDLDEIPKSLLIIGGGIIGLEMATVYSELGSKVEICEYADQLMPGADKDLVNILHKKLEKNIKINMSTLADECEISKNKVNVKFKSNSKKWSEAYDYVLVSVGRIPNSSSLGLDKCNIEIDDKSFIVVNEKLQTKATNIYAIGDVIGQPMLAHKAAKEGKLAAEIISNRYDVIDYKTIPSVAYTSPEVAWMGLTETYANQNSIEYETASFPWAASGRAQASNSTNGLTKILFDKKTKKILGAGIVGENAGELISESVLGLEMGANIEDIALTVHPHPTLSETTFFASEIADGTITDLYIPKK